jgi:multicomponent Na+:H+ antiporter subunit G
VVLKLMMILLMTLFINPAASHALAQAAMRNGHMPVLKKDEIDEIDEIVEGVEPSNP